MNSKTPESAPLSHREEVKALLLERANGVAIKNEECKHAFGIIIQKLKLGDQSMNDTEKALKDLIESFPDLSFTDKSALVAYRKGFSGQLHMLDAVDRESKNAASERSQQMDVAGTVDNIGADTRAGVTKLFSERFLRPDQLTASEHIVGYTALRQFEKQADTEAVAGQAALAMDAEAARRAREEAWLRTPEGMRYGPLYEEYKQGRNVGNIRVETGIGSVSFQLPDEGVKRYSPTLKQGLDMILRLRRGNDVTAEIRSYGTATNLR